MLPVSPVTGQVLADALTRVITARRVADYSGTWDQFHDHAAEYADLISKSPRRILAGHLLGLAIAALRHGGVR